jgi:GT2 family glycosyltransferase
LTKDVHPTLLYARKKATAMLHVKKKNMCSHKFAKVGFFTKIYVQNNVKQHLQWQALSVNREFEPAVSIIVPVRNGEKTIPALLESLMKLDYNREKLEFLVVDGNSIDKTKDVVKQYPSVKLIIQNGDGLNAGRNTGIRNSKSEIIAFTDSDCVIPVDWVRNIVKNFDDPQIGCLGGNIKGYDSDFLSQYADNSFMPVLRIFKKHEVLDSIELFQRYPAGCNMAFRRKTLEDVGGFDEGIRHPFEEDEAVERVCKAGYKMVLDPNCLVLHKHRSSLKELLKQNFSYGRGIGFLLKKKKTKEPISRWALLNLLGFLSWFSASVLFILILTLGWKNFYIFPLSIVLTPLLGLAMIYALRAIKNRRYERIVIYPFIDLLRELAFSLGEVYQLFKKE